MPNCQNCGVEIPEGMNICGNCAPVQSQQQAPPPSGPGKGGLIAIITIVIVGIIIVAVLLILFSGGGSSSPSGAMESFVDNINAGNTNAALHNTDAHFMSTAEFNEFATGFGLDLPKVTISNMDTRYQSDMTPIEISEAEDTVEGMEDEYGINITEFSMIDYTISVDGDSTTDEFLSVKVGESWYIVLFGYYEGSGYTSTPVGSWISIEATSGTTGRLTFGRFTEDINPEDLRIFITEGNVTYQVSFNGALSSQTTDLSVTPSGIEATYFDYNYAGNQINSGDYITLSGLTGGTSYNIELFHTPTDAIIMMTGANPTFTTPP